MASVERGRAASLIDFSHLQSNLDIIAQQTAQGRYDALIKDPSGRFYQLIQTGPDNPIKLTVTRGGSSNSSDAKELAKIVFYPDNRISSVIKQASLDPHFQPEFYERRYITFLNASIQDSVDALNTGWKKFSRMDGALRQLQGSYQPSDRSLWYKNHAVLDGRVYSLQLRPTGPFDINVSNNNVEIVVYEESVQERRRIVSLSPTGEINADVARSTRQIANVNEVALLESLARALETATKNPGKYQGNLAQKIHRLKGTFETPVVAHAFEQPNNVALSRGPQGEPIVTIRDGRTLWKYIRPFGSTGHVWLDPADKNPPQMLKTPWRLRWPMLKELGRWMGGALRHGSYEDIRDHRPPSGYLRLHLEPGGGGEMTVFRGKGDGHVHDIIRVMDDGRVLKVGDEIARLKKQVPGFRSMTREQQVERASGEIHKNPDIPWNLKLQEVQSLRLEDLNGLHQGGSVRITDAQTAWEQIKRLPQMKGIEVEVSALAENGDPVPKNSKHVDRIVVEFPRSNVPIRLVIRQSSVPVGPTAAEPRVDIFYHYGVNQYEAATAYQAGRPAPNATQKFGDIWTEAMQGQVRRNVLSKSINWFSRFRARLFFNGMHYAIGHFATIPLAQGIERLVLTEGERKLIGTPSIGLDFKGFTHGAMMFGTMWVNASVAAYWTDAVFNYGHGLYQVTRYKVPGTSWLKAYQTHRMRLNNVGTTTRPLLGPTRNFFQRFLPIAAGLTAIEFAERGVQWDGWNTSFDSSKLDWQRIKDGTVKITAVSLLTTGIWQYVNYSARASLWAQRARLLTTAVKEVSKSRFSMTGWGTLATILLEFGILRAWDTAERLQQLRASESVFRRDLAYAVNIQNEYISRVEHGEDIPLERLAAAYKSVKEAESRYRDYLNVVEHHQGAEDYRSLKSDNDFQDVYESVASTPGKSETLDPNYQVRLMNLRSREPRLEQRLQALYQSFGINPRTMKAGEEAKHSETLMKVAKQESKIYRAVAASSLHVTRHTRDLAKNTQDLDSQMRDYYRQSEMRINRLLPRLASKRPDKSPNAATELQRASRTPSQLFGLSAS